MISDADRARIADAIRAAEARTSGEIVCVLAQSSVQPGALPVLMAAVAALALPWLLLAFTDFAVARILLLQALVFLLLLVLVVAAGRRRGDSPAGRAAPRPIAPRSSNSSPVASPARKTAVAF